MRERELIDIAHDVRRKLELNDLSLHSLQNVQAVLMDALEEAYQMGRDSKSPDKED